ncbi:MAG: metallophosphoesterase family protein [Spirochaetales bacterium]|jgi:predicted phosphodiesterase|nr:metallophosphoesterase family protein [Spirochaetales bacterium]
MIYVIFSDIHGNLDKFSRMHNILRTIPGKKRMVSLGDITGGMYNHVQQLYDEIRWGGYTAVQGNCDDGYDFTDGPITVDNLFIACHGSPYRDNDYIRYAEDAARVFPYLADEHIPLLFYGHTHRHYLFEYDNVQKKISGSGEIPPNKKIMLDKNKMYLCNPGTLGKPKPNTPFCSFVLFDSSEYSLEWKRV